MSLLFASVRAGIRDADGKRVAGANIVIVIEAASLPAFCRTVCFCTSRGAVRKLTFHTRLGSAGRKQRFRARRQIRLAAPGLLFSRAEKAMAAHAAHHSLNAAPTMPEYAMSKPALYPRLIPSSAPRPAAARAKSALIAALTQPAGSPADGPRGLDRNGERRFRHGKFAPDGRFSRHAAALVSGAATKTRPNGAAAAAARCSSGADSIVVCNQGSFSFSPYTMHSPVFFYPHSTMKTSPDSKPLRAKKMRAAFRLYLRARMWCKIPQRSSCR